MPRPTWRAKRSRSSRVCLRAVRSCARNRAARSIRGDGRQQVGVPSCVDGDRAQGPGKILPAHPVENVRRRPPRSVSAGSALPGSITGMLSSKERRSGTSTMMQSALDRPAHDPSRLRARSPLPAPRRAADVFQPAVSRLVVVEGDPHHLLVQDTLPRVLDEPGAGESPRGERGEELLVVQAVEILLADGALPPAPWRWPS